MTRLTSIAAVLMGLSGAASAGSDNIEQLLEQERQSIESAVRVYYPTEKLADKAAITFHNQLLETNKDKGFMVMSLSDDDKAKLKTFGFTIKPANEWIAKRNVRITQLQTRAKRQAGKTQNDTIFGYSCYATVEGSFARAEALAQNHSQLAKWVDIGDSWQKTVDKGGYDIKVLQMTNSATTGEKPILFIHSAMHAREYATAELTLRFAEYLLNNYGQDADATWILDNHQVHVLFQLNPDGRKKAETGLYWRKNTNENYCGVNSNSRGADLNRNFSYFFNSANGSSGLECDDTYRGPNGASEPETQAIEAYVRSIFADNRGPNDTDAAPMDTTGMHIDVHSYSQLVLWPWGHTYDAAPNATELTTLGRKLAYFNGYQPMQSVGLYPTDGTSDDVSYGELGVPALTYELGTRFFQDCGTFETQILPDNLKSLIYAAKVVRAPYVLPAGPDAVDVSLNGHNTVKVSAGSAVTLTAKLDDGRYRNSNGTEPSQNIAAGEYYFNQTPWSEGATGVSMTSSDGTLNSSQEMLEAQIDTTGLADGSYLVYVRGQDAAGNWGPVSAAQLLIGESNNPPVAQFSVDCNGVKCRFDAAASNDSDGTLVNYAWDMGDGAVKTGADTSIEHTYSQNGDFTVQLTVTDDSGLNSQMSSTFRVVNLPPLAEFSVNCSNNTCTFNGATSSDEDGEIASYSWQLSDGGSGDAVSLNHTFAQGGNYNVELTVTDNLGVTASKSSSVSVTMPTSNNGNNSSTGGSSGGSFGLFALIGLLMLGRRRF